MKKIKTLFTTFVALLLSMVFLLSMAACGETPDDGGQGGGDGGDGTSEYVVTFHYGFDASDFDAATNTVTKYKSALERKTTGNKITLNAAARRLFEVEGYEVTGYSTDAWEKDGITSDLDVNVLYTPLKTLTVTFKNADGSVINEAVTYSGANPVYPDTVSPIYIVTAAQYNKLGAAEQAKYESYAYGGDSTYYIATADKARLTSAVVIPVGKYFTQWSGTISKTENYELTATLGDGDATIAYTTSTVTIDGQKDAGYELISPDVDHIVVESVTSNAGKTPGNYTNDSGKWNAAATQTGTSEPIKAEIYAQRSDDFIYLYIEVTDGKVVWQGKDYSTVSEPWMQDRVELWFGRGGKIMRLAVDAFGYDLRSTGNAGDGDTKYLDYIKTHELCKTRLIGDDNVADYIAEGKPKLSPTATGYAVEIAIPCYEEPTAMGGLGDTPGSANWGRKMGRGESFYIGLQIDSASAAANEQAMQECKETNSFRIQNTTYYASHKSELDALEIMAFGCQVTSFVNLGTAKRLMLG